MNERLREFQSFQSIASFLFNLHIYLYKKLFNFLLFSLFLFDGLNIIKIFEVVN